MSPKRSSFVMPALLTSRSTSPTLERAAAVACQSLKSTQTVSMLGTSFLSSCSFSLSMSTAMTAAAPHLTNSRAMQFPIP
uniref:Putative secreted protein n=1 Tax=Ixodes ricinus TaxID=34613 RepID=A0A6B0U5M2_IXORI